MEWDGLEGSFGIFGLRASLVGMPNVPESEGMESGIAFNNYFNSSLKYPNVGSIKSLLSKKRLNSSQDVSGNKAHE